MTYEKICEYIYNIPKYTKKNDLEHTKELLRRLGNPEQNFGVIHVAGSNGKGSVCAFINSVLCKAGRRTGLFTSPHLVCMEERFAVNGTSCSQEEFIDAFVRVQSVVSDMQMDGLAHPAFFEFLFAMGMLIFAERNVEYAVLETGLGGRLDATNVIAKPLMTIITSISLEHTEILGETIAEIAAEKAGIIKADVPVVFDAGNPEAASVIRKIAAEKQASYYEIYKKNLKIHEITGKNIDFWILNRYDKDMHSAEAVRLNIPFAAEYQMINAALAYQALDLLRELLGIDDDGIQEGMKHTVWHGRMQEIEDGIYFDGAHNAQGIAAFVETVARIISVNHKENNNANNIKIDAVSHKEIATFRPMLLFSMMGEKDYRTSIGILSEQVAWDKVILTKIRDERGLEPEVLAAEFGARGIQTEIIADSSAAYEYVKAHKKENQTVFCAGSLYLIGELEKAAGGISR